MKRILLIEDDASIRRFVQLALEDLAVTLVEAPTLASGRAALAQAAVDLVITDLMLPDGHGLDLVESLRAAHDPVPVLLFSAGVSGPVRQRAAALQVTGVLEKPVSMVALVDEVQRAAFGPTALPAPAAPGPGVPGNEQQAIAQHFGGNASLFMAFKASSLAQLQQDSLSGDEASARGDRAALRLLAHSLKTVLGLLGHPAAGDEARRLEALAASADSHWSEITQAWAALRGQLPKL